MGWEDFASTARANSMTGYGTVASYLGYPDAGLATYTDMLNRTTAIAEAVKKPLIAAILCQIVKAAELFP